MGVYSEVFVPSGTILYKGLPVNCDVLLKNLRAFYLTDQPDLAKEYGKICPYRVKKTLKLFEMTHENIKKLLDGPELDPRTKTRIKLAFGTRTTVSAQVNKLKKHVGAKAENLPKHVPKGAPGQRASWANLDRIMDMYLAREFLTRHGYDGYYASRKKSVFHAGHFQSEIMLTNAHQKIERARDRLPVLSRRQLLFPQTVSRLFLEYSKKHHGLLRPSPEFVVFCTGGQAVNQYLRQLGRVPKLIRNTSDFDLSFAVPRPVPSLRVLKRKENAMYKYMLNHMKGFVNFINKNYKGANATYRMIPLGKGGLKPVLQVPATRRRTYLVHTWQVRFGRNVVDVADCALAEYPNVSRNWISKKFSKNIGIPIQQIKYQFIDALAILSGSFLYKGPVALRNPLTGKKIEKGQKNVARVNEFSKVIIKHARNYKNLLPVALKSRKLLHKIQKGRSEGAENRARSVNALVKQLVA